MSIGLRGEGGPSIFGREHRGVNRGAIRRGVIRTPVIMPACERCKRGRYIRNKKESMSLKRRFVKRVTFIRSLQDFHEGRYLVLMLSSFPLQASSTKPAARLLVCRLLPRGTYASLCGASHPIRARPMQQWSFRYRKLNPLHQ